VAQQDMAPGEIADRQCIHGYAHSGEHRPVPALLGGHHEADDILQRVPGCPT
jgi:hypothetical protein